MKIKLNSFAAAISVVLCALSVLCIFVSLSINFPVITARLEFNLLDAFNTDKLLFVFSILPAVASFTQLMLTLFCRRCALPALIVVPAFYMALWALLDNFAPLLFIVPAFLAILIILTVIFYRNASKAGLAITYFVVTAAFCILPRLFFDDTSLLYTLSFLSLAMLCLALQPKEKNIELPAIEEITEHPDITVKVETVSLSQTLDALLDKYSKGEISKEEYDALKRETLWKV